MNGTDNSKNLEKGQDAGNQNPPHDGLNGHLICKDNNSKDAVVCAGATLYWLVKVTSSHSS